MSVQIQKVMAYHNVPNSNMQFKWNASCRSNEPQNTIEEVRCPTAQIIKNNKITTTETKKRYSRP